MLPAVADFVRTLYGTEIDARVDRTLDKGVNGESALSNWRQRGTLLSNFQYEEVLSAV